MFAERLQQAGGVSEVVVTGGREKEIAIVVNKDKLSYYGLTLKNVIDAVKGENVIYSAGSVYSDVLQT
ncbi:MAG: efflux RND transporter permease subunit, partial [Alistipes sp.]|nr:efflux RND transporter permease subunit [Alistipes sp.]